MAEVKQQQAIRLRWWPSPQDYSEAVQNLSVNSVDPELRKGLVYVDALGLPRPVTGAFASVYRFAWSMRTAGIVSSRLKRGNAVGATDAAH